MNVISQFYGIFLTVLGLGLLINKKHFQDILNDLKSHASAQLLMALVPLLLGAFLVLEYPAFVQHNLQHNLLTVIGWILLLSGVIRILVPDLAKKIAGRAADSCCILITVSSIMLLLGLALLYLGFDLHTLF